ncbi:hypothetical protein NPX13_g2869 [Xylaria arbuscula]|uniref:Uncharacterized protein n=1 Tax=Xylaria arbuscula TaxID=114810 RepID=A0A9W8NJE2_9PEZI|nr:hypothetical protein NPX13_g2869 [Xylaria arbuscula]
MPKLVKSWPYAAASTGRYRGRLEGKLECWDANGPARAIFNSELHVKIKDYIVNNLPESCSFIGFSLFMVGRSQLRTSPTVLIVSDDKPRRKAAFEAVKSSGLLAQYPGFHVAHCRLAAEFEDLQPMAGRKGKGKAMMMTTQRKHGSALPSTDCGIYISMSSGTPGGPLLVHDHASGVLGGSRATIGRLLALDGVVYGVTVAHVLPGRGMSTKYTRSGPDCNASSSSDDDDDDDTPDFETTAMDDSDEEDCDLELCSITSEESRSLADDVSYRGTASNRLSPTGADSPLFTETEETVQQHASQSDPLYLDLDLPNRRTASSQCNGPDHCRGAAAVLHAADDLDLMLIVVDVDSKSKEEEGLQAGITVDMSQFADSTAIIPIDDDDDVDIVVRLLGNTQIPGRLSATAFHAQYGATRGFQRLYLAKLAMPLWPGDCGSWVYARGADEEGEAAGGEKMVGMVVAGSPTTGSVLILPGETMLDYVRKNVSRRGKRGGLAEEELFL